MIVVQNRQQEMLRRLRSNKKKEYPYLFRNQELDALNWAYNVVLETLEEYLKTNEIDNETLIHITSELNKVFNEKQAEIHLSGRIEKFSKYLHDMLKLSIAKDDESDIDESIDYVKLTYKKNLEEVEY